MKYTEEFRTSVLEFLKTHTYLETQSQFKIGPATVAKWANRIGYSKIIENNENNTLLTEHEKEYLVRSLLGNTRSIPELELSQQIIFKLHLLPKK
jgi:hypothetical protein